MIQNTASQEFLFIFRAQILQTVQHYFQVVGTPLIGPLRTMLSCKQAFDENTALVGVYLKIDFSENIYYYIRVCFATHYIVSLCIKVATHFCDLFILEAFIHFQGY